MTAAISKSPSAPGAAGLHRPLWKERLRKFFQRPDIRRTPTLLQMEAVECGAASLGMILGYYKRIVPLSELRQSCGISRDGSKASNLITAARNYQLEAKGFKVGLDKIQTLELPYIVFWNFNHFLVVEGFHRDRVHINDPATGPRSISLAEFDESFTGVVLTFQPGQDFVAGGKQSSIGPALFSRLMGSVGSLLFCAVIGLLLVLPGLAMPTFSRVFIDQILIQNQSDWLRPMLVAMVITALLTGLLTRLQLQILRQIRIKLAMKLSSQFVWHILHLPLGFYAQRFSGEISNRIKLNDRLADLLSGQLVTTSISCFMVMFYGFVMWSYDPALTLMGISFAGMNLFAMQWVARQRADLSMRVMQEQGKVGGVAIAGLQSIETLKASGLESDFFTRWAGHYAKALNARQAMDRLNQKVGMVPSFLTSVSTLLLLSVGGWRVMNGALSIGSLIAFQSLLQQFLQPVNQLNQLGGQFQELGGTLERLDDVLAHSVDPGTEDSNQLKGDTTHANHLSARPKLQGALELKNITFGYNPTAPPLIENLSLVLQPGQRVALIGGSGSGKSTVAKLVAGLYQPWSGEVCFDGQPRSAIPRPILANSVAMIEQEVLLFSGTVRDNLTLWDTTIPNASLVQACRDAAIQDMVLTMPGGYDAELTEGASNLSGGQRQRLEIARSLVNNPSILLLDEATSALDTETERLIDYNLKLRGCTCLIVAHRLSTIRDCDEIIVLNRGKVVQRGNHDQLRQQEGPYLDLIRSEGG